MTNEFQFPYAFKELTDIEKKLTQIYGDVELMKIVSTQYSFPKSIKKYASELYNFKPRPDDIWLVGHPRSGTTLTQEILYLLGTNLDYKKAASSIMDLRFPFFEQILMRSKEDQNTYEELCQKNQWSQSSVEKLLIPPHVQLAQSKEKRFIKSHMGFNLLPPNLLEVGCKVVFIARNVKDCMVSDFYLPFTCFNKEEFDIYDLWLTYKHELCYMGSWFEHLKAAWERRHHKNLLFLLYEEVNADKRAAIIKIAEFLGKEITEEELETLLNHIDINNFKKNKSLNNDHLVDLGVMAKNEKFSFIRKGGSGGWKGLFSPKMNEEMNEWIMLNFKKIPDFVIPECWKTAMELL